jgi:shikimate dehydrogenase
LTTRLAVLGSPIAHSKSPLLHGAAYGVLGLDWSYEAIELTGDGLADFVASRGPDWRGLSLTMPLKRDVLPMLARWDETVALTEAANTVLLGNELRGFNTDVYGITEAFRAAGVESLRRVLLLGGGATAASAMLAASQLGATAVDLHLRDPLKVGLLQGLALDLSVDLTIHAIDEVPRQTPDAVISTLPGYSEHGVVFDPSLRQHSVLFDVAYDPWPSTFAASWLEAGGRVISGLEMLTLQALAQVRVFVNGSPDAPLDDEEAVLAAMQRAVAP